VLVALAFCAAVVRVVTG